MPGLVETELRWRAEACGLHIGWSLPEGALSWSWVPYLPKRDFYDALRWEALLTVGYEHSQEGRLHLACLRDEIKAGGVGEPLLGHDWGSDAGTSTVSVPPTLVPSMHDTRIVSVASRDSHCLALSAEGEVYSWGVGAYGELGVLGYGLTGAQGPGRGGSMCWRAWRAWPPAYIRARRSTIAGASSPGVMLLGMKSRPVWVMSLIQRWSAS